MEYSIGEGEKKVISNKKILTGKWKICMDWANCGFHGEIHSLSITIVGFFPVDLNRLAGLYA